MINREKILKTWREYDEISNKETDYFIQYLEALRQGNKGLANYVKNKILPKLSKKSYLAFINYYRAFNDFYGK